MIRKTKILITDDHALFREGIHRMLETEQDLEVVGEAQDARDALNKVGELMPDIVLMDINMPGLSSIEAAQQIKKTHPNTKVLFLTMYDDQEYIVRCLKAEAAGYVLKDTPSAQLITAIREVTRGGQYISPLALKKVMVDYLGRGRSADTQLETSYETLTAREREVLKLLAEGLSIKEVAGKLTISAKTADVHKSNLMRKLDIHDRAELIKYAIRNKLIKVGH
jgi:two-component system, NarL family, response regulator NreC